MEKHVEAQNAMIIWRNILDNAHKPTTLGISEEQIRQMAQKRIEFHRKKALQHDPNKVREATI